MDNAILNMLEEAKKGIPEPIQDSEIFDAYFRGGQAVANLLEACDGLDSEQANEAVQKAYEKQFMNDSIEILFAGLMRRKK